MRKMTFRVSCQNEDYDILNIVVKDPLLETLTKKKDTSKSTELFKYKNFRFIKLYYHTLLFKNLY